MTIGGAIGCVLLIALIILTVFIAVVSHVIQAIKTVWISIGVALCLVTVPGFLFYYNETEAGKRAVKTEKK